MIGLKEFFLLIAVCSLSIMLIGAVEHGNSGPTRENLRDRSDFAQAKITPLRASDFAKYESCSEIELSPLDDMDDLWRCNGCCTHKERKEGFINDGVCSCEGIPIPEPAQKDCSKIEIVSNDQEMMLMGIDHCKQCCVWQGRNPSDVHETKICSCGEEILY